MVIGSGLDCLACAEASCAYSPADQGIARVGPKVWLEVKGSSSFLLGYMACGSGSDFHVELAGGLQRGVFPVARALGGEPRFFSHLVAPPFIHKNSLMLPCIQRVI